MQIADIVTHIIPPNPKTLRGASSFIQAGEQYLLYFNGCTVVLRPYNNSPSLYINHTSIVTAAKYSHGFKQVASVDEKGNLMIHDVAGNKISHNKTFEQFYMGAKSIDWTSDNKRICVVGSAKNKFGRVVGVQTGTDVGQISAVSATLNTVAFKPQKPYKIATGGDQHTIKFYQGPPFKFVSSKNTHKNFINQIKYSPDGTKFVSVSSDKKIIMYDGSTSEILKEVQAHSGSIMGISWVDNQTFITGGCDKKLKKWNTALQLQAELNASDDNTQLSLIDTFVIAVSYCQSRNSVYFVLLSGQIKQADKDLSKITKSFESYTNNPNKIISLRQQKGSAILLDSNGKILKINSENSEIHRYLRKNLSYNKLMLDICVSRSGCVNYLSGDEHVHSTDLGQSEQSSKIAPIKIEGARFISAIDVTHERSLVCYRVNSLEVYLFKNGKYQKAATAKLAYEPTCVNSYLYRQSEQQSSQCNLILVSNAKGTIQVFGLQYFQGTIKIQHKFQFHSSENRITCIKLHQNLLFIGDSMGGIKVWKLSPSLKQKPSIVTESMCTHRSIISSVIVKNNIIYTFSMDNSFSIWNLEKFSRIKTFQNVHKLGIKHAELLGDKILTCGGDLLLKIHQC